METRYRIPAHPFRWIATLALAVLAGFRPGDAAGQLGAATAEAVYGGTVRWIDAVDRGTTTRVFAATESANSLFYVDVSHATTPPSFTGLTFQAVEAFDVDDGFGQRVSQFAADGASGHVFVVVDGRLLAADVTGGSTEVAPNGVSAVAVRDGRLFYVRMDGGVYGLYYGTVDPGTGAFTAAGDVSLAPCGFTTSPDAVVVNPGNDALYVFAEGAPPTICKSSDAFDALAGTTTFASIGVADLTTSGETYTAFGAGPDVTGTDGRLFAGATTGAEPNHTKYVAYSDDDGAGWTTFDTGVTGQAGYNVAVSGTADPYYVFFGTAVSTGSGAAASWTGLPNGGTFDTHPNDGPVAVDPNDEDVVYLTTDLGFGVSTDRGVNLSDFTASLEAVQVNDFDMEATKEIAWTASKSGVRQVTSYTTGPKSWSVFWPMGDGSPYYSVAMDQSDATGGTAWAGNTRLYYTDDAGANWSRPFTTEDYPGTFDFFSYVAAIAVHPNNADVVFIGVNSPTNGVLGGLFYTDDGGATWNQISTEIGGVTFNPEVLDLLLVPGTGDDAVVYVASEDSDTGTTAGYGVKTVTYASGVATYSNTMTGTSGVITNFSAHALAQNPDTGDIYASGANVSDEPRVYRLPSGSSTWTALATAGLPATGTATAVTVGEDSGGSKIPYVAVVSSTATGLYYQPASGGPWQAGPTYPTGTEINVLYWDELLVGTGTGLFAHGGAAALPVELVAFTAQRDGADVVLRWHTASETNNAGFEVMRRSNVECRTSNECEGAWQAVAFVEGHGTSLARQDYSFRVAVPAPGVHRFRLKQVDYDGTFAYSPEVEVDLTDVAPYRLEAAYPNPFNPSTTIRYTLPVPGHVTLDVYDALGRRVATLVDGPQAAGAHDVAFDAAHLPAGLYLYRLRTGGFREARTMVLLK